MAQGWGGEDSAFGSSVDDFGGIDMLGMTDVGGGGLAGLGDNALDLTAHGEIDGLAAESAVGNGATGSALLVSDHDILSSVSDSMGNIFTDPVDGSVAALGLDHPLGLAPLLDGDSEQMAASRAESGDASFRPHKTKRQQGDYGIAACSATSAVLFETYDLDSDELPGALGTMGDPEQTNKELQSIRSASRRRRSASMDSDEESGRLVDQSQIAPHMVSPVKGVVESPWKIKSRPTRSRRKTRKGTAAPAREPGAMPRTPAKHSKRGVHPDRPLRYSTQLGPGAGSPGRPRITSPTKTKLKKPDVRPIHRRTFGASRGSAGSFTFAPPRQSPVRTMFASSVTTKPIASGKRARIDGMISPGGMQEISPLGRPPLPSASPKSEGSTPRAPSSFTVMRTTSIASAVTDDSDASAPVTGLCESEAAVAKLAEHLSTNSAFSSQQRGSPIQTDLGRSHSVLSLDRTIEQLRLASPSPVLEHFGRTSPATLGFDVQAGPTRARPGAHTPVVAYEHTNGGQALDVRGSAFSHTTEIA